MNQPVQVPADLLKRAKRASGIRSNEAVVRLALERVAAGVADKNGSVPDAVERLATIEAATRKIKAKLGRAKLRDLRYDENGLPV